MAATRNTLMFSVWMLASACTLDNEPKLIHPLPYSPPESFSFHHEPECGFPKRTLDSLTRDSLIYTDDQFYATKTVFRKKVSRDLIQEMAYLFDSLRIDSLSGLNVHQNPCGPQTADCKSHDILRVRRDSVIEYSDTRRCIQYDTAFLKAFMAFEGTMHDLRNK